MLSNLKLCRKQAPVHQVLQKQQQTVFIPWKADHTKQMIHESRIFLSAIHGSRLIRIFPSRARKKIGSHTITNHGLRKSSITFHG
jgi:hypothetical protein